MRARATTVSLVLGSGGARGLAHIGVIQWLTEQGYEIRSIAGSSIGALVGVSGISFWPIWLAGGIGAALGDWVSYWFGYRYKEKVAEMWPLSRYPEILPRGEAFVRKWGVPSIFIGRFFGPLRASVPLAAGIFEMAYWPFQIANFVSALVWSAVLLLVGDVMGKLAEWLWRAV